MGVGDTSGADDFTNQWLDAMDQWDEEQWDADKNPAGNSREDPNDHKGSLIRELLSGGAGGAPPPPMEQPPPLPCQANVTVGQCDAAFIPGNNAQAQPPPLPCQANVTVGPCDAAFMPGNNAQAHANAGQITAFSTDEIKIKPLFAPPPS